MPHHYSELLKLCGFGDEDMEREKSRIDQVFDKLEFGPRDFAFAEKWVRENHDVELAGVRKILGLWLLEFIDLVLAKQDGKNRLFSFPDHYRPCHGYRCSIRQCPRHLS